MSALLPTQHSEFRLLVRSNTTEYSVTAAWEQGFPVTVKNEEEANTRLHSPTRAILYARGDRITTVKNAKYETWYSPHTSTCANRTELYDPIFQGLVRPYCEHDNHEENSQQ